MSAIAYKYMYYINDTLLLYNACIMTRQLRERVQYDPCGIFRLIENNYALCILYTLAIDSSVYTHCYMDTHTRAKQIQEHYYLEPLHLH